MFTGSFGKAPDLLALIVVSVEDDETLDERWMRSHENFGSDKDPVTGRCETYVSLAIHVAPSTVESGNPGAVEETVVAAIRRRLSSPSTKGPKGFDSDACFTTVSSFLHRGGPA